MKYTVNTFRDAGLEARWGRTSGGAPIIFARDLACSKTWFAVHGTMWKSMQRSGDIMETFRSHTLLGDFFSIPA